MRYLGPVGAALTVLAVLQAAPVPKGTTPVKNEEAFVGSWVVEKYETGGRAAPSPAEMAGLTLVFEKDGVFKMTVEKSGKAVESATGTFKLDPTVKVKTLDLHIGGEPRLGIYTIDGDSLTLCLTDRSIAPRPSEFSVGKGGGADLVVLKRVK